MTILHIIDHSYLGGAQRIVEGIIKSLPNTKVLPLRAKKSHTYQASIPARQYLLKPQDNILLQFVNLLKVPKLILHEEVQIVQLHLKFSWLFGLILFATIPPHRRPKFIFTEHDSMQLERWYYPFFIRMVHKTGSLIAVSHYVKDVISSYGVPSDTIFLLPNYVAPEMYLTSTSHKFPQIERSKHEGYSSVGFVGRLTSWKGWRFFLEMADLLRNERIIFCMAGDGRDLKKIRREIHRSNLEDRVFVLGYVDQIVEFYHSIDVLAVTSQKDTFGLVQVEAQACDIPVVGFENVVTREISGDDSILLVPNENVEALAQVILDLINDRSLYKKMVRKGKENAQKYNLENYLTRLQSLYDEILHEH